MFVSDKVQAWKNRTPIDLYHGSTCNALVLLDGSVPRKHNSHKRSAVANDVYFSDSIDYAAHYGPYVYRAIAFDPQTVEADPDMLFDDGSTVAGTAEYYISVMFRVPVFVERVHDIQAVKAGKLLKQYDINWTLEAGRKAVYGVYQV